MADPVPKTRKPNFTEAETLMILDQVEKHKDVLTSKLADTVTNERKKDTWLRISEYINERSGSDVCRSPGDIRRRWKNMVGAARKEVARIKTLPPESGPVPAPSDLSMQILDMNPEWQDFSSYNANGPDPALSSFMKVEMEGEDDDDDNEIPMSLSASGPPSVPLCPRLHTMNQVGDNSMMLQHDASQGVQSYPSDNSQPAPKKRRIEEAAIIQQEIIRLDRENITLEREKVKIEKEKLSVEKEQLAIERQKLGMEREKLTLEKERMIMEKEKLTLEISYWKRKLLQTARNPFDTTTE